MRPDYEVAQCAVKVGGTMLVDEMLELHECVVEDTVHLPSMATLRFFFSTIDDPDLKLVDGNKFVEGADIEIKFGFDLQTTEVFSGEIVSVEADFNSAELSSLTVRCLNYGGRLSRLRRAKTWLMTKDSEIARAIATEHGLSTNISDSRVVFAHTIQDNQTDWEFLQHLAFRGNMRAYVKGKNQFVFEPIGGSSSETIDLRLGQEMRTFRPTTGRSPLFDSVEVRSWDNKQKKEIIGSANRATEVPNAVTNVEGLPKKVRGKKLLVSNWPVPSQDVASNLAKAYMESNGGEFVTAEAACFGMPTLRAGVKVRVAGVGKRFGGVYKVTTATHTFSTKAGYQTTLLMSGTRTGTLVEALDRDSDLIPKHFGHGLVIGIVTNNKDPENMGRVKVKYPTLGGDIESDWARLVSPMAGNDRGFYCLPEVNDEVLVGFEHGNAHRPYVLGALWSQKDKVIAPADETVKGSDVVKRYFKTRIGHVLTFDDSPDEQGVTLVTKGQNRILVSDKNKSITIETQAGNKVVIDDRGKSITMTDSASNKVEIATPNISIECKGNLTLKSTGNMSLEATGQVTMKGTAGVKVDTPAVLDMQGSASTNLKSSGILIVQGSLVKIN